MFEGIPQEKKEEKENDSNDILEQPVTEEVIDADSKEFEEIKRIKESLKDPYEGFDDNKSSE